MKVWWLCPDYPDDLNPAQWVFLTNQVEALARSGIEVQVISPVPWIPPQFKNLSSHNFRYKLMNRTHTVNGIIVHRPRYLALPLQLRYGWAHLAQWMALKSYQDKPDLIHAQFAYPQGAVAGLLAEGWKIPSMITLRGDDVIVYPHINQITRKRFIQSILSTDAVTAVSEDLCKRANALVGVQPQKIYSGINLKPYQKSLNQKQARERLGLPIDAFIVLFIGTLIERKGVRDLLAALDVIDDTRCIGVFVGEGDLRLEINRSKKCSLAGNISHDKIPEYLAAANVLTLPSHWEGLPNVILEAGAVGMPVIGTNVGGIPELLKDGCGYLINSQSPQQLTNAILEIRDNYSLALEKGKRLNQLVHENFDVDKNIKAFIRLYRELLEKKERQSKGERH